MCSSTLVLRTYPVLRTHVLRAPSLLLIWLPKCCVSVEIIFIPLLLPTLRADCAHQTLQYCFQQRPQPARPLHLAWTRLPHFIWWARQMSNTLAPYHSPQSGEVWWPSLTAHSRPGGAADPASSALVGAPASCPTPLPSCQF